MCSTDFTQVATVAFQAITTEYVNLITKHMQHTADLVAVTRRDALQMWAYGSLWCTGARQPCGGKKGDTYDLYAHHTVQTPEGIEALFHYATVSIIFISVLYGAH